MQALVALGLLAEEPQTATDLRARPIWSILSDRGHTVGVIGWPLTQPAPVVNGFAVSDAFHRLPEADLSLDASPAVWPGGLLEVSRAAMQRPVSPDPISLVNAMGAPQPANDFDVGRDQAPIVADRTLTRRPSVVRRREIVLDLEVRRHCQRRALHPDTTSTWAHSSAGRARGSQSRGRGFDPPCVHQPSLTLANGSVSYGSQANLRSRLPMGA